MKLDEFDYDLPPGLIAQAPLPERDDSRLMVLDRRSGDTELTVFRSLPSYLRKDDLLVVNNSRVIPARLTGRKTTGAAIELLLLRREGVNQWQAMLRPGKRVRENTKVLFGTEGEARLVKRISDKKWIIRFDTAGDFDEFLKRNGQAPLPPYIKRTEGGGAQQRLFDLERYQTVYARVPGSVAAPTAGLHFTDGVVSRIGKLGAQMAEITLHVGYGTFLPITTEDIEDHVMEEEFFEIGQQSAAAINRARRVIAVGTTSTRVLESVADAQGRVGAAEGSTRLFIYPGYRFKRVEGLITNFHLPKSSLFLLASAFAGRENLLRAYERAIKEKFRFYSYGDCMLII
jgi:S-adenosylmethionine:tRNA ribosyltransferase-isomerase